MSFPANYTLATTSLANSQSVYPPNRYFRSDTSGVYEIAVVGYANSPYTDLIMKLPFTFNQKDSINSYYKDLAKGKDVSGSTKLTADATGTLITPSATYNNTYRFHKHKFTEFTTSFYGGKETSIGDFYSWYTPGIHDALLSINSLTVINTNSLGVVTNSYTQQWSEVYSDPNNPLGIEKNKDNILTNFSFQNPVSSQLQLTINSTETFQGKLEISDLTGKIVIEEYSNNNVFRTDVSGLTNGIYIIQLSTGSGLSGRRKMIINH